MRELKLPELGEDIDSAEISEVLVSEGDEIERDQPVVVIESEKASFEVPAEFAGRVVEVLVSKGDTVKVGQVLLKMEPAADGDEAPDEDDNGKQQKKEKKKKEKTRKPGKRKADEDAEDDESGEDRADETGKKDDRDERETDDEREQAEPERETVESPRRRRDRGEPKRRETGDTPETDERGHPRIGPTVPAAPSVRALARELGVDILQVAGSGPGGRISMEDVKSHARTIIRRTAGTAAGSAGPSPIPPLPDFSEWGPVERVPLGGVRKATARNMAVAWAGIPHVTQGDEADVTELEAARRRRNDAAGDDEAKITLTAIVVRVAAAALRRFPEVNASLDLARSEAIEKRYVHVGVAVDTERGLLVPVIRDADDKSVAEIAEELDELADRAREGGLGAEEMRGACFTVTNLGGLGTTWFSPIVNWPEAAILGVGRADRRAVAASDEIRARRILPLSLSYDHRLIDGAGAARFLRAIASGLEQPWLLALGGG